MEKWLCGSAAAVLVCNMMGFSSIAISNFPAPVSLGHHPANQIKSKEPRKMFNGQRSREGKQKALAINKISKFLASQRT